MSIPQPTPEALLAAHELMEFLSKSHADTILTDIALRFDQFHKQSSEDHYALVKWPDTQDYQEEEWFEKEAILDVNGEGDYLIPVNRLKP